MPKRTNPFQKLIALVNKQLAGNAYVKESAMLKDAITGREREVDVLIKATVAGYETRIAIECIDWKRKAGVPWVEQMFQKHQSLPTDKLILVSKSGFARTAIKKARFLNIFVLNLENAIGQNWLQNVHSIAISSVHLNVVGSTPQLSDSLEDAVIEGLLFFLIQKATRGI